MEDATIPTSPDFKFAIRKRLLEVEEGGSEGAAGQICELQRLLSQSIRSLGLAGLSDQEGMAKLTVESFGEGRRCHVCSLGQDGLRIIATEECPS